MACQLPRENLHLVLHSSTRQYFHGGKWAKFPMHKFRYIVVGCLFVYNKMAVYNIGNIRVISWQTCCVKNNRKVLSKCNDLHSIIYSLWKRKKWGKCSSKNMRWRLTSEKVRTTRSADSCTAYQAFSTSAEISSACSFFFLRRFFADRLRTIQVGGFFFTGLSFEKTLGFRWKIYDRRKQSLKSWTAAVEFLGEKNSAKWFRFRIQKKTSAMANLWKFN